MLVLKKLKNIREPLNWSREAGKVEDSSIDVEAKLSIYTYLIIFMYKLSFDKCILYRLSMPIHEKLNLPPSRRKVFCMSIKDK